MGTMAAKETTVEKTAERRETQPGAAERRRDGIGETESKSRIVIVDGHTLFRRGVRNILELEGDMEVVGEAGSGREAITIISELTPDVVLMDLTLPAPNGIETTQRVKRELPHTAIIVLAPNDDEDQLFEAIKAGAAAYVLKDIDPTDLIAIIRRVRSGEYLINDKVFSKPAVASRVLKEFRELAVYGADAQPIFAPLSPREVEILDNIAQGMTNKQVAYALGRIAGHFAGDFFDFALGLFGRAFDAIFVHRCPHLRFVGWDQVVNAPARRGFRDNKRPRRVPPRPATFAKLLRFDDGDDLVRPRIDDQDLIADVDVIVTAPFRIDIDDFNRQRIEVDGRRNWGSHRHRNVEMHRRRPVLVDDAGDLGALLGRDLGSALQPRPGRWWRCAFR